MKEKTNSHGESTMVEGTRADSSERVSTATRKQKTPVTHLEKLKEEIDAPHKPHKNPILRLTCEAIKKDIDGFPEIIEKESLKRYIEKGLK